MMRLKNMITTHTNKLLNETPFDAKRVIAYSDTASYCETMSV